MFRGFIGVRVFDVVKCVCIGCVCFVFVVLLYWFLVLR